MDNSLTQLSFFKEGILIADMYPPETACSSLISTLIRIGAEFKLSDVEVVDGQREKITMFIKKTLTDSIG